MAALRARRDTIVEIAASHGATNVRVFGSVARGTARPASDIDLLVDLEPGRSLLDQARLWRELETLLGRNVDVITSGGLTERDDIRAEAVAL